MKRPEPPAIARRILEVSLPDDARADVVGDLDEVFRRRHEERGARNAAFWYARESLAFTLRFSIQRWRDRRTSLWLEATRDVRIAVRRLVRRPGFAVAVVVTLALGIGANAGIYQIVEAVRLRSLPVPEPERLAIVEVSDMSRWQGRRTSGYPVLSNPLWERIRDSFDALDGSLAWASTTFLIGGPDAPSVARGLYVSGEYFDVLGVQALVGRTFHAEDDRPGCALDGVVVSQAFWQRALGSDPNVVGRTLVLDSHPVPVLGVTRPGFTGLEVGRSFDVAVPICAQTLLGGAEQWLDDGMVWWLTVMGRVPEGRSMEAVSAELGARSAGLFEATLPDDYPVEGVADYLGLRLRAVAAGGGVSGLRTRFGDALVTLLGATILVLLIVCTNLANLFLASGSARRRELAVRRALGASRVRLFRELVIEAGILTSAGALAGSALGTLLSERLVRLLGPDFSLDVSFGVSTAAFVVGAATLSCLVFGVVPAWQACGQSTDAGLDAARDARGAASAARGSGLRRTLVVSQVALSFVLLFAALLFTVTLRNLLRVDTGFDATDVTVARLDFRTLDLPPAARPTFKRELLERIAATPGVLSAAEVRHVPLGGTGSSDRVRAAKDPEGSGTPIRLNGVTIDYFEAMGMGLMAGRRFGPGDAGGAPVAVVTSELARRMGLGENPVGETILSEWMSIPLEVIGMVPDAKYFDLREEPVPTAFVPKDLLPDARSYTDFVVRSTAPPGVLREALRAAVDRVSSEIWIDLRPLDDEIRAGLVRERLMSMLSGLFGVLAALVASVGLYGVMSYQVGLRTREIAVRVAMGAEAHDVLRLVLVQAGALLAAGLALGAVLAFVAAVPLESFLFGLGGQTVPVYVLTAVLLGVTASIACALPARRAAAVAPRDALTSE